MSLRKSPRDHYFTFNRAKHDITKFFQNSEQDLFANWPSCESLPDIEPLAANEDLQHADSPGREDDDSPSSSPPRPCEETARDSDSPDASPSTSPSLPRKTRPRRAAVGSREESQAGGDDAESQSGGGRRGAESGGSRGGGASMSSEEQATPQTEAESPRSFGPTRDEARRRMQQMRTNKFTGSNPLMTKQDLGRLRASGGSSDSLKKGLSSSQLLTLPPRQPSDASVHESGASSARETGVQDPEVAVPSCRSGSVPVNFMVGANGFDIKDLPAGIGARYGSAAGASLRRSDPNVLRAAKRDLLLKREEGSDNSTSRSKLPKRAAGMHPLLAAKKAMQDTLAKEKQQAKEQCMRNNVLFVDDVGFEEITSKFEQRSDFISQQELVENLKSPTEFTRYKFVKGKVRKRQVQLMLDNTGKELICMDVKGTKSVRVRLVDVAEVRKGQKTKTFENSKDAGNCILLSFSLIYANGKDLNLIARAPRKFDIWVHGLIRLISLQKEDETEIGKVRNAWQSTVGDAEMAAYRQLCAMLYKLNIKASTKSIKKTIKAKGDSKLDGMTFDDFLGLIHDLRYRKEIDSIFAAYASHAHQMRDAEVLQFLHEDQREYDMDMAKVQELLLPFKTKQNPFSISRSGFADFLISKMNHVFNTETATVYQDMTRPLTDYFIHSSHNTYLEGNQISGFSSSDMYSRVLKAGCRCVELDCWDGDDGEPIIFHGHTLTTRIQFEDACIAIRDYAFFASDYPVILSLENHCCIEQQKRMAAIMINCFGSSIAAPITDPEVRHLPSPKDLKKKIILKGKTLTTQYEYNNDGTIRRESKIKVATELSDITMLKTMVYAECSQFVDCDLTEDDSDRIILGKATPWEICSFSELALKNLDKELLVQFNKTNFSRIYPKGSRIESSNYSGQPFWSCGCQLVALNLQTMGKVAWANQGRFTDNGGCGYVLKPREMLHDAPMGAIHPGTFPKDSTRQPVTLVIEILSARQLPKSSRKKGDIVNPFVTASIVGMTCDSGSKSTKVVRGNGFNPYWGKQVQFELYMPEMATLLFLVYDEDTFASLHGRFKIAYYSIPVACIKEGYRIMELFDERGQKCAMSNLFCRFTFKHD